MRGFSALEQRQDRAVQQNADHKAHPLGHAAQHQGGEECGELRTTGRALRPFDEDGQDQVDVIHVSSFRNEGLRLAQVGDWLIPCPQDGSLGNNLHQNDFSDFCIGFHRVA